MSNKTKAFIFDLDGVIVDTAKFHFQAWKNLANSLGIDFSHEQNEQLKGVSRVNSLKKILDWGNKTVSEEEFQQLMDKKNQEYLQYVDAMGDSEILPQVKEKLQLLKDNQIPIALGSASKNARRILDKINLTPFFDEIVDGTNVTKAKPNPEVFLVGAEKLGVKPAHCIVFEDSISGIQAANIATMTSIGIGNKKVLMEADYTFQNFTEISDEFLIKLARI
jgi:beta-phosphoglucomutase